MEKPKLNSVQPIHVHNKRNFFVDIDKKENGIVVPIVYINDKMHFILFRARYGRRKGRLEFPGGTREECDISAMHTALRETIEETCLYLDISLTDLELVPYKRIWKSCVFYVTVPQMTDEKFQENLNSLEENDLEYSKYKEMDKLFTIPAEAFLIDGIMEFPKTDITINYDNEEHVIWRLAALCIYKKILEE